MKMKRLGCLGKCLVWVAIFKSKKKMQKKTNDIPQGVGPC